MAGADFRVRLAISGIAFLLAASPVAAGQCEDNFTQSGNTYRTFVEIKGADRDRAFVAIEQNMSSFLAFNANKELGIISGYQETAAGRKSTHTTVFSEPAPGTLRVEATFVLAAVQRPLDLRPDGN